MNRPDDTATAHRAWDETWKSEAGRADWRVPEAEVTETAGALYAAGARDALDIGCGIGRHAIALARLGFRVTALDASTTGLDELARAASAHGLEIAMRQAPMTEIPLADGTLDYVLSWNVIYHGDPQTVDRTIGEILRVLKPGGTYQGTMLTKQNSNFGVGQEIAPDTWVNAAVGGDKAHPHFYCDADRLYRLFSGFEVQRLDQTELGEPGQWHWHLVARKQGV